MSTRPNLRPQAVIVAGSMAIPGPLVGAATILQGLSSVGYGFSWTGTSPVGALSLECSNDYALDPNGQVANAGTWNTMTVQYNGSAVTTIPISGNTGSGFIDVTQTAAYAVRPRYTPTSGTGNLTAIVNGKVS